MVTKGMVSRRLGLASGLVSAINVPARCCHQAAAARHRFRRLHEGSIKRVTLREKPGVTGREMPRHSSIIETETNRQMLQRKLRQMSESQRSLLGWSLVALGLFTVILVGVFVENVVFNAIENRTVRRWGMQAR